jgi:hypothetical protein
MVSHCSDQFQLASLPSRRDTNKNLGLSPEQNETSSNQRSMFVFAHGSMGNMWKKKKCVF